MDNVYEQIDSYLLGELDRDELEAFERQMLLDKGLVAAVEEHRQAIKVLEAMSDYQLRKRLTQIHQEVIDVPSKRAFSVTTPWILGVAATFLLLGILYFTLPISQGPSDLFSQYYEPYPLTSPARNKTISSPLEKGLLAYQEQNFSVVQDYLHEAKSSEEDAIIFFALGMSHMSLDQPDSALFYLNHIAKDPLYGEPASWYLALSYLQKDSLELSKRLIDQIPPNTEFYQRAKKLSKEMKHLLE